VWRKAEAGRWSSWIFAAAVATIWTTREWLSTNFPYGGFPWSRLSMTQANAPSAHFVAYLGLSGLTFLIALAGALTAAFWLYRGQLSRTQSLVSLGAIFALLVGPIALPVGFTKVTSEITVLAVQGNAKAGLFANPDRGQILQNHLDATVAALDGVGDPASIDLIVWPENASDLDPLRFEDAYAALDSLTAEHGVPLAFGTVTKRSERYFNTTMLWIPEQGIVDYYDKKRPVPFAEYVPDRPFWRLLAPDLIDLISRGYEFGTRDGIFKLNDASLGSLICFEIAVDDIPRSLVNDGAEIILSQTNNADFGYSDETFQQVAIAKLRALETGRTVVNISTVGKSAIFNADGSTVGELDWYTADAMLETVELRSGVTPAHVLAQPFELLNALAVAGLAISIWITNRTQSVRRRPKRRVRK
jgi:apolipoprotein N-acyltransferase